MSTLAASCPLSDSRPQQIESENEKNKNFVAQNRAYLDNVAFRDFDHLCAFFCKRLVCSKQHDDFFFETFKTGSSNNF